MKRCYFIHGGDDEGFSVVATSAKEAKKVLWRAGEDYHPSSGDFIDLKVKWQRKVDVYDLDIGTIIETMEGLYRGCYGWADDMECPICKKVETIISDSDLKNNGRNFVGCWECIEKEIEKTRRNKNQVRASHQEGKGAGVSVVRLEV